MHLYELSDVYRNLTASLDDTELNQQVIKDRLQAITGEFNDKVESIGKLVLELESENLAIDTEVDRLTNRKRVAKNKIEWLKSYVLEQMLASGIEKIPGQVLTLSAQKAPPSVIILDTTKIPKDYMRIIPETQEPDKTKILKQFNSTGEVIDGCEIKTDKKILRIR